MKFEDIDYVFEKYTNNYSIFKIEFVSPDFGGLYYVTEDNKNFPVEYINQHIGLSGNENSVKLFYFIVSLKANQENYQKGETINIEVVVKNPEGDAVGNNVGVTANLSKDGFEVNLPLAFQENGKYVGSYTIQEDDPIGEWRISAKVMDQYSHTHIEETTVNIFSGIPPLQITTPSLPNGTVGQSYSYTLQAIGGRQPYSWSIPPADLPLGLTLKQSGEISGTPTTAGQYPFTVTVSDGTSNPATKQLSITIVQPIPTLTITTTSLPEGTVGQSYSQTLQATGGKPPYSWNLVSGRGNLPPGLTLNPSSGVISGTPTAGGTFNFTVQVKDSEQRTDTQDLSLRVIVPVTYSCRLYRKDPDATIKMQPGEVSNFVVAYTNTGSRDWKADFSNSDYIELRSCDFGGNAASSFLYPGNGVWVADDKIRVVTQNAPNVAPGEEAWFIFLGKVLEGTSPGVRDVYFRPWHKTGGYIQDWGQMHFTIEVTAPKTPPDVSLARIPSSQRIYFIKNGKKFHILDEVRLNQLAQAYGGLPDNTYDPVVVGQYPFGSQIIGDGFIFKGSEPTIYLYQNGKKRRFVDEASFKNRGYDFQKDPLSSTYTLMPNEVIAEFQDGDPISTVGVTLTLKLIFEKNGSPATEFAPGETKVSKISVVGEGYTAYPYVRITSPGGVVRYAYHDDGSESGNFLFSAVKIPFITEPDKDWVPKNINAAFTGQAWVFNTYTFTGKEEEGEWLWEFWFEDVNDGIDPQTFPDEEERPIPGAIARASYRFSSGLVVDFSASPTSGQAPLTVQFTDQTTGNPNKWEWDFDNDGTIDSFLPHPSYTYQNPGSYTVTLTAYNLSTHDTRPKPNYISVTGGPSPLAITTTSLPRGTVGVFYDGRLNATGGTLPYTWTRESGTFPPGLQLTTVSNQGVLSGTPTAAGSYPFTVKVTDSSNPQQSDTQTFTVTIDPAPDTDPPPAPPNLLSLTHQVNTPSRNNNPVFTWDEPSDDSGIAGYSYHLDQNPGSMPDKTLEGPHRQAPYVGIPDENWYFHVRAKDNDGNWGDASHYGPVVVEKMAVIELKNVYHVPSQTPSIQDAIIKAQALGGIGAVVVHAGTYTESVWLDPGVMLIGAGADVTTIQPPTTSDWAVVASDQSLIAGFTITNGSLGIHGALHPGLTDCYILNNRIINNGSGIVLSNSSPTIIGNEISGNDGSGIYCQENSHPLISNNRIFGNRGSTAISCYTASSPNIINNVVDSNAQQGIGAWDKSTPIVMNNIITNHSIYNILGNTGGNPVVLYNLIYPSLYSGITFGEGNILEQEPLFVDAANHNYHLQAGSPAIDAGTPDPRYTDNPQTQQGGVRNDMGAYGGPDGRYDIPPIADFSAPQTSGKIPFTVQFQDATFGTAQSYRWDFGDGVTSTEATPTHTYTTAGDFTVTLTATGSGGATKRIRQNYFHLTDPGTPIPDADFIASPRNGVVPLRVEFTDTSTNNPTSWYWEFGDQTWSVEQNPIHVYSGAGRYTVRLTVSNDGGEDSETQTDYIVVESSFPPGEITQFGPHVKVNTIEGSLQNIQLKVDRSGTIYVAFWVGGQNAIMFTRSVDHGVSFIPEQQVNPQPAQQMALSMGMDSNGNIYLAWFDYSDHLWLSKSTDGGNSFSHYIVFNGGGGQPTLVVNDNNEICILWRALPDLVFSKSVDGGNTFSPPVLVTNTPDQKDNPTLAVKGSNVYVIWIAPYSTGDVHLARSTNGGTSFQVPVRVNRTPGQTTWGNSVAVSPSGMVYVAYLDTQNDPEGDVYLARSLDGGQSFSSYTLITDSTLRAQQGPKIYVDDSGKIYATWWDFRSNDAYFRNDIYYSESIDNGLTFSANVDVTPIENDQVGSLIDVDGSGNVYLIWIGYREEGDADIYFTSSSLPTAPPPDLVLRENIIVQSGQDRPWKPPTRLRRRVRDSSFRWKMVVVRRLRLAAVSS